MSKRIIVVLSVLILIGVLGFALTRTNPELPASKPTSVVNKDTKINYTAGFAIYTNGTFRVFTAAMYHNQSLDVYIQADNPNIIHVKKMGITWDDFFKTLPFKLTKDCLTTGTKETFCTNQNKSLKFYLNGVRDDNLLDREIKQGDLALISYGSEDQETLKEQLEKVPQP